MFPEFSAIRADFWWRDLDDVSKVISEATAEAEKEDETVIVVVDDRIDDETRKKLLQKVRYISLEVRKL